MWDSPSGGASTGARWPADEIFTVSSEGSNSATILINRGKGVLGAARKFPAPELAELPEEETAEPEAVPS